MKNNNLTKEQLEYLQECKRKAIHIDIEAEIDKYISDKAQGKLNDRSYHDSWEPIWVPHPNTFSRY